MPLYDYNCKKCDIDYEILVDLKLYDQEIECPNCKNTKLDRLVSAPYFKVN